MAREWSTKSHVFAVCILWILHPTVTGRSKLWYVTDESHMVAMWKVQLQSSSATRWASKWMRVELSRLTEGSLHQINVQWTVVNLPWHAFFGGSQRLDHKWRACGRSELGPIWPIQPNPLIPKPYVPWIFILRIGGAGTTILPKRIGLTRAG